jgi:anti-sigma factor RsiW
MKCQDLLAHLNDYVDGRVDAALCAEFEKHMAGCNPCQVVVDNIRCTITLYRDGQTVELPVPFKERLHAELRRRWADRGARPRDPAPSPL